MKWLVLSLCLLSFCVLSACEEESKDDTENSLAEDAGTEAFLNFDQLEQYGKITSTSLEYTEFELIKLAEDDAQKDYEVVIRNFVRQELNQEASFLDSVDGTYNPRSVVVGTKEGNMYSLRLRKWYNYKGIWTVVDYAPYHQKDNEGAVPPQQTVEYEYIEPTSIDKSVQEQVKEKMASTTGGHHYFNVDGTIYILLVAGEGKSIELLNIFGNDYLMEVKYALSDITDERYGKNPHVLIKVNSGIYDLFFKRYSSVEIDDVRLNMP